MTAAGVRDCRSRRPILHGLAIVMMVIALRVAAAIIVVQHRPTIVERLPST